jgi:succinoglycan biosynthesis transport protein ExoP
LVGIDLETGKIIRSQAGSTALAPTSAEAIRLALSPGHHPQMAPEPALADYWRILLKRKWTIAATTMIVLTLAAIYTLRITPTYDATARLSVNRENPDPFGVNQKDFSSDAEDFDYTVQMDTQVRILQGDSLAMHVIRALHLESNPRFAGSLAAPASAPGLQAPALSNEQEQALINKLRGGLTVTPVPNTRLIDVRVTSPDPQLAAAIANAYSSGFVELNRRTKFESTQQASEWLSTQLADLEIKVETSQQKLVQYQKEHGIIGTDEKTNIITAKLDDLNKELTSAEADRIIKQSAYQQAVSANAASSASATQSPLVAKLRTEELDLQDQLAQLTSQFGPQYPKVQEVTSRLQQVRAALDREVKNSGSRAESEYQAALQRERMLRSQLDGQKQEANQLNQSAIEYNLLKREADSNRQLYDGLLQKLKEAGVSAGLKSSNIRQVDVARVPLAPARPNIPRNLMIALMVGFAGGITLAFLLEVLDNTVRTPEQVESIAGLPALGIVPLNHRDLNLLAKGSEQQSLTGKGPSKSKVGMIAHTRPKSGIAESYRALRTSILLSSLGAPPKIILITSALPQEGKTTTSVNTAIVLAQKGGKVLLVDCDMRRPGVHSILGFGNRSGLSTMLAGDESSGDPVVMSRQLPNLWVLPSGPPPPQPSELLASEPMQALLEQWAQEYDHIILDTPPTLSVTDAVLLSVKADAVVLVIRSGQTTKDALRRARDLLLHVNAKVMGVVVNAVDLSAPDLNYQYYYGSKYGGRYYDESARP